MQHLNNLKQECFYKLNIYRRKNFLFTEKKNILCIYLYFSFSNLNLCNKRMFIIKLKKHAKRERHELLKSIKLILLVYTAILI